MSSTSRVFAIRSSVDAPAVTAPPHLVVAPQAVKMLSPALMNHILIPFGPRLPLPQNAPVANAQSGSLLEDRIDPHIRWYLPAYLLADTPDISFSFSAMQTGDVDAAGSPFNKGTLKLSLKKTLQPDASAFRTANPAIQLREVPVHVSSVTLTTTSRDPTTGQAVPSSYQGAASTAADGSLQLTFDNIVGPGVIILYQNLTASGDAKVLLTGSCDVVYRQPPQAQPSSGPIRVLPSTSATVFRAPPRMMLTSQDFLAERRVPVVTRLSAPGGPSTYTPGTLAYSANLALESRFAANIYQLKYTITGQSGTRPILNAQDLKSFALRQSEFAELKSLGDISSRYPSLSRAYMGVLSRTIVIIPQRYTIVRGKTGCFAACLALLDSSPSAASKCKFGFTFNVAPDASPVEMLQLAQEIAGHPELKDYQLKFPDFLADKPAATLATIFASSFQYSAGPQPHTFALSVELRDQDLDSPAVNNANLLLTALATSKQPYLTGSIGLKLDDGFSDKVQSTVVLNFAQTSGSDDLSFSVDETSGTIQLLNLSPFDLALSRCALGVAQGISETSLKQTLAAGQTTVIPLPTNHAGLVFAADAELAVPVPMTKADLSHYLAIGVQDVADTQVRISVNSSGVDFTRRGIDSIQVQVTFPSIPQLIPAPFSLNKLHTADGTMVLVPIQSAITELDGTVQFTAQFLDTHKPNLQFTKQNDFCSQALLVLQDADLPPT